MRTKKKSIPQSAFSKQAALEPETTSVDGLLYRVLRPAFQQLLIFALTYIRWNRILRFIGKNNLMKKKSPSQAGVFRPRALLAFALCSMGAGLGLVSFASTPSSGTLTDVSGPMSYTAGPFFVANPTPVIFVDQGPECAGSAQPCDDYALTVTLPAGYTAAHPTASVKVTLSWTDTGSGS